MNEKNYPPRAKKLPVTKIYHNDTRVDNYDWMGNKTDPGFIEYLKSENEYYENYMADYSELTENLYKEIIDRIPGDDSDFPYKQGEYLYYYKSKEGKNYRIFCRKKISGNSKEEVLLDINLLAEELNLSYCNVELHVSRDNSMLMYAVDSKGDFSRNVFFKDLETGMQLLDVIKGTVSQSLTEDKKYVFYSRWIDGDKGKKVFRHKMGTGEGENVLIYEDKDDSFFAGVTLSKSGRYIFINIGSVDNTEHWYIDTAEPESDPQLIISRNEKVKSIVEHNRDYFYILTDYRYENFRLMRTKINNTSVVNWEEVVPGSDTGVMEEMEVFKNFIALKSKENALTRLRVYNIEIEELKDVSLPDKMCMIYFGRNPEFDSFLLRFNYTSFLAPFTDFEYNMSSGKLTLLKEKEVRGDYNKEDYITERIYAPSRDGRRIPLSLVYKKGLKKNGSNPLLLYAYGAFGINSQVWFSYPLISLLDRGFIFAIAHIRGGVELGKEWHNDGRLLKKMNSFNDIIDSAQYLIREEYTNPQMLFAEGGSAGGTLMGVASNTSPELFKGLIINVPAADLLNTSLEKSNFNAVHCMGEYGNPEEKVYYDYIKSYDPYTNISKKNYPSILITTGYNDGNVSCSEPAKYSAKLREFKEGENEILLHTDFESGHMGASGRYKIYRETSEKYAFLFKCLGVKE
jgi:oligopeptidase B